MSEPRDARDVIARDLYDYHPTVTGMMSGIVRDLSWHELVALGDFPEIITQNRLQADAILEALADAGYAVVRKGGPDDRYEQGYTDGGNSKLADVILFFDEVFEVEPVGYDLNARIVKELEERF